MCAQPTLDERPDGKPALHDRPREKLARAGATALGDNELVALLLGSGVKARSALVVAQDVLAASGGVRGLLRTDLDQLRQVRGVGAPRAARLLAAVELGRRALAGPTSDRLQFVSPAALAEYLMPLYSGYREERFGIVLLDAKRRLLRTEIVSIGTLDASIADPRDVFRAAVVASASALAMFHNHPSGDPLPSPDDIKLTRRLAAAGVVMGIDVVDHVILGDGRWFSFRVEGII
jgi:DNA repair protein RadC